MPGALVGVWISEQGDLIIEGGVSDIGTGEPISKRDDIRIGRVTKSFTVPVLLQPVDEGLLSLDDPFVDKETGLIEGNAIDLLPVGIPGTHYQDLPLDLRIVEFP